MNVVHIFHCKLRLPSSQNHPQVPFHFLDQIVTGTLLFRFVDYLYRISSEVHVDATINIADPNQVRQIFKSVRLILSGSVSVWLRAPRNNEKKSRFWFT
jgi:hypothetical protein